MERGSYVYEPRNPRDGQQTVGRSGGLGQLLTWSPRKEPAQPTPALGLPAPGTETALLSVPAPRSGPRRYVTPGKQMPCVTLTWPREGCSLRLLPTGVKTQSVRWGLVVDTPGRPGGGNANHPGKNPLSISAPKSPLRESSKKHVLTGPKAQIPRGNETPPRGGETLGLRSRVREKGL